MSHDDYPESIPWYPQSLDFAQLERDYPPPPTYFKTVARLSRDELYALQERRFLATMERGWEIAFFQRHWRGAGMEPGDIKTLEDLRRVPPYDVSHLRKSIQDHPPFGDFMGLGPEDGVRMPLILQTSGGTTGLPRPMFYSPQDRQGMAIIGARRMAMIGIRPGDMVLCAYSMGLANGGMGPREALWFYTGAVGVMTGSGANTPTRRQIELIRAWKINVILGFPSYLRHMALVARDELGIDPRSLGIRVIGTHLGMEDAKPIEDLWGAPALDMYGTHENGIVASECRHQTGMHAMEDAFALEIADPETGRIVEDGTRGCLYITSLFKWGAPQIRFNINDISAFDPGDCPCGMTTRRLQRIFGRYDGMVKLRGVNVFPEAIGATVVADARTNGEFFCFVDREGAEAKEEMDVWIEVRDAAADRAAFRADMEQRFKETLGVRVKVTPVGAGELDRFTGTSANSKVKRLLDRRH
jgi:phenylacetate-CoA ligase